jgi:type VI secretion system secreted protein Hcp
MAVDYYLKVDSIDGESADDKHKNEIQLLSYSWGGTQTTSVAGTGGSGAGKVNLSELAVTKYLDKATPKLFKSMVAGTHIANATLTAIKAGTEGKPFLTVTLGELFVTSIHLSASTEVPVESVSFSYNTIKIDYSTQDESGTLTTAGSVSYNLKANIVS